MKKTTLIPLASIFLALPAYATPLTPDPYVFPPIRMTLKDGCPAISEGKGFISKLAETKKEKPGAALLITINNDRYRIVHEERKRKPGVEDYQVIGSVYVDRKVNDACGYLYYSSKYRVEPIKLYNLRASNLIKIYTDRVQQSLVPLLENCIKAGFTKDELMDVLNDVLGKAQFNEEKYKGKDLKTIDVLKVELPKMINYLHDVGLNNQTFEDYFARLTTDAISEYNKSLNSSSH